MKPRPSLVFDTLLAGIVHTALLFSLFLLFAGHNAPGGGFVGGLTAGTALLLQFAAGGVDEVDRTVPFREETLLGGGVVLAGLVGAGGLVWGDAFLASAKVETGVGVLGTLKATTALPFDIGVYLVVVGITLAVVRSLGRDADTEEDTDGGGAAPDAVAPTAVVTEGDRGGAA